MTSLFEIGLTNAALAGLLAIVVWLVTRVWRHPSFVHALWVIVLMKLMTPPIVTVPWPSAGGSAVSTFATMREGQESQVEGRGPEFDAVFAREEFDVLDAEMGPPEVASSAAVIEATESSAVVAMWAVPSYALAAIVWVAGSIVYLTVSVVRLSRFHWALGETAEAPDEIAALAKHVAMRMGFTRDYRLRVTEGRLPPLVWPIGRASIVLSRSLLDQISPQEAETLLAHEFAHLRRRDHWVRWLELAVTTLYWWHPVVWWARRAIHRAEEQVCDVWVVAAFPQSVHQYADALFKAVQFVSDPPRRRPMLASGLTPGGDIKQRIECILDATWSRRLPVPMRLAIVLAMVVLVPISLRAVRAGEEEAPPVRPQTAKPQAESAQTRPADDATDDRSSGVEGDASSDKIESSVGEERIRAGMLLRIQATGAVGGRAIDSFYTVEPEGDVALGPDIGRVRVGGLTVMESEAAIVEKMRATFPGAAVQVTIADRRAGYHVQPGDILKVEVFNAFIEAPIADEYRVEPSGSIALGPEYGRVKISGQTLEEAERTVKGHLAKIIDDPQVRVTPGGWQHWQASPARSNDLLPATAEGRQAELASREEIEVLREHIKFLEERFKRVDALYQKGTRGGSADVREMAACELARAQGELALVEGKREEAREHLANASAHADKALRAVTAAYEAGQVTHDIVLQAANDMSAIKRRLVQVKNLPTESASRGAMSPQEMMKILRGGPDDVGPTAFTNAEIASQFAQLNSPLSGSLSISVLKKMAEGSKQDYEQLQQLALEQEATTAEVAKAKSEHEINMAILRQAERALESNRLLVELAEQEYELVVNANKLVPNAVSEAEVRKRKLMVELAKAKLRELAE